jgi:type IV secretory pathway VirB9-like protein
MLPGLGAHDPRMRVVAYDASNVTRLLCAPGRSTSIELGVGEVVDTIAVGDDKAWVVAPAGNRVFVTPNDATGPPKASNMQVVSRKVDGATRLYQFDLVPVDPGAAMAGLRIVYPDDIRAERAPPRRARPRRHARRGTGWRSTTPMGRAIGASSRAARPPSSRARSATTARASSAPSWCAAG